MSHNNKKYISISEVSRILSIPTHKLRYLEKTKPTIEIFQIRGRRYYTHRDIELIKQKISTISNSDNRNVAEEVSGQGLLFDINNTLMSDNLVDHKCVGYSRELKSPKIISLEEQTIVNKIDSLISRLSKIS